MKGKLTGDYSMGQSASLLPLQPPDALGTQVLGHSSEKGSTNRESAAMAAVLCA